MKIYTGTGDRGRTSLFSGQRVSKANERIETYGDMDELNSLIGALVASLTSELAELTGELEQIQTNLFTISALMATTPDSPVMQTVPDISQQHIEIIENAIDRMQDALPELKGFILPGGHSTAAWAHLARTICRRTERKMVYFLDASPQDQVPDSYQRALIYINRLSDYFFVVARYCNYVLEVPEKLWEK